MNIQITNIPNGQKIKSIDFKITFDESGEIISTSSNSTSGSTTSIEHIVQESREKQERQEPKQNTTLIAQSEEQTAPTIPVIDISNREAKIPEEMLEESF